LASETRKAVDSCCRISRNMSAASVMIAMECRSAAGRWLSLGGMKLGTTRNRAGLYGNAAATRPARLCYARYLQFFEFGVQSWRNCLSLYSFLALLQHF